LGHPIVTNGDFATWHFPNYFGKDLLCIVLECDNHRIQCQLCGSEI